MYLDFFQFQREPFQVTPDPAFFCSFQGHREALAAIHYGVEQRKGFIALTGEVGVGKTTILRAFLEQVDQRQAKVVYLLNANVMFDDLLDALLQELGSASQSQNQFAKVIQIHGILIEHYRQDRNVVLIIDEAQNMPAETLEGLRVLSNLETDTDKLLQIVFCGQPEFDEKLAKPELRQLQQRIAVRTTIRPLTDAEGMLYIRHRIAMAGVSERAIFSERATRQIVREAHGIPRLINILCDNALATAFGYQDRQVKWRVAKEIIADHKVWTGRKPMRWRLYAFVVITVSAAAAGVLLGAASNFRLSPEAQSSPVQVQRRPEVRPITESVSEPNQITIRAVHDTPADEVPQTTAKTVAAKPRKQEPEDGRMAVASNRNAYDVQPLAAMPATVKVVEQEPVERIVKSGDRLMDLVEDVYGIRDERLVQLVKRHNAQIKSRHLIHIGDRLIFPPVEHQE